MTTPAGSRTILCVDDEESILASLRRLFFDEDWRVLCARSGPEGLALVEREAVAVVLSDQRMPGMTGTEMLREVKRLRPDTVRILLSGFAEISTVVEAINDGEVSKFIAKPWDDEALLDTVRACLRHYELQVANRLLSEQIREQYQQLRSVNADLELRNSALSIYQEILEEMPVGVLGIGTDGTVALANAFGRDLLGSPGELPLGKHYRDLLPVPAVEAVDRAFETDRPWRFQMNGAYGPRARGPLVAVVQPLRPSARERGVLVVVNPALEEVNT